MTQAAHEFAVVCEACADRDSACSLADRVLMDAVDWIDADTVDAYRQWRGVVSAEPFLRWASVKEKCKREGIQVFGKFGGQPGQPDAYAARLALLLLASSEKRPSAVVLLRDSDGEAQRRLGLEQARAEREWPFPIAIGLAEPKRECWVLTGFEPKNEDERRRLDDERRRLSLDPVRDAHELTAREHGAKKDAKKVLDALTDGDLLRERACLEETPLSTLSALGSRTGLAAYLQEIRDRLVPVLAGQSTGR